jgi:hypothetical protein
MLELNLAPDAATLRRFGFIALGGFGVLAVCARMEWLVFAAGLGSARDAVALGLGALGVFAALCSLAHPPLNRALWVALTLVGYPIGFLLSHLILAVLFFGVFAPIGALLRMLGHDAMRLGRSDAASYWTDAAAPDTKDRYFRQY